MSNHPRLDPTWVQQREDLKNKPWREDLLSSLKGFLKPWGWDKWADKVGSGLNEIEIDSQSPTATFFGFEPLKLLWVQFNTHDPNTKKLSHRTVRFGPDAGTLMVLVKIPDGNSYKWYLLARRKYQFAAKDLFFEFFRGWINGSTNEDRGWKLFDRDLPGLKENPLVASISEQKIVSPVFENTADQSNKLSRHLIVVTLKETVSKDQLQKMLVEAKLNQEYPDENPSEIDPKYLTSYPFVLELSEAAKYINAYLEEHDQNPVFFGEDFSVTTWSLFLNRWGWQFPELCPEKGKPI